MESVSGAGSTSSSAAARHGESLADLQRRLSYLSMAIDHTLSDPHHHRRSAAAGPLQSTATAPSDTVNNGKTGCVLNNTAVVTSPPPVRPVRGGTSKTNAVAPSSAALVASAQPFVVDAAHRRTVLAGVEQPAAAAPVDENVNRRSLEPTAKPGGNLDEPTRLASSTSSHAYQRIEAEKRELVEHQRRLLELDLERQALEERRAALVSARSTLRARSLSQASSHASGSTVVSRSAPSSRSPSPMAIPVTRKGVSESPQHSLRRSWGVATEQLSTQADTAPISPDTCSRHACRLHLQDAGLEILVLTGKDTAIECQLFLSADASELIALPQQQQQQQQQPSRSRSENNSTEATLAAAESHHFPLLNAAVLYPNGVVQHHWMPKRVHIRGIVVGNRARSVLIAKGFPFIASTDGRHRHRLYFVVGGDAYSDESTLLVVQTANRVAWLTLVMGIHEAMWPDGKPTLTRGRALWLYACHAVMQQYWEANEIHETVFQTSQRRLRSRSKDAVPQPMRGPSGMTTPQPSPTDGSRTQQQQRTLPVEFSAAETPSGRFSVPNLAARTSVSSTPPPSPRVTFLHDTAATVVPPQLPANAFRQGKGVAHPFIVNPHGGFVPLPLPVGSGQHTVYPPARMMGYPVQAPHQPGTFFPRTSSSAQSRRPLTSVVQYNY